VFNAPLMPRWQALFLNEKSAQKRFRLPEGSFAAPSTSQHQANTGYGSDEESEQLGLFATLWLSFA
jgi:hypothetical protein